MDSDEAAETAEIRHIQRKDVAHAVDVHRGSQARVMNLNAQDAVLHDNSPPLSINRVAVGQEDHASLDCLYLALGIARNGGCAQVKEGLTANWVVEYCGVSQLALNGARMGVLVSGTFYVKEGGLFDSWVQGNNGGATTMSLGN